jgi:hypothetical protein
MSRLDRLKEQHPDLNISLIDIISFLDPTDSYKYTEFLIKNFKNDSDYYSSNKDEFMGYMGVFLFGSGEIETLNEFERHSKANRIKNKDISQYANFLDLNESVVLAQEIENRKKLEKEILKIHEDDTWFILTPLSFEASKVYGANTKWCVTQEKYWNQYLTTHRLIYVLNKKTDTKIAFSRDFLKEKFQAWDQLDKEVDPMFINFIPDELFLKIRKELQKDERTIDLTGIKISETPNDILSRRDMALRMWDGRHVFGDSALTDGDFLVNATTPTTEITTINNDSRRTIFSEDMVERIRRLIRNQPSQQLQPIRDEPYNSQTMSNRPNVNYTSTYDDYVRQFIGGNENYLDDLP